MNKPFYQSITTGQWVLAAGTLIAVIVVAEFVLSTAPLVPPKEYSCLQTGSLNVCYPTKAMCDEQLAQVQARLPFLRETHDLIAEVQADLGNHTPKKVPFVEPSCSPRLRVACFVGEIAGGIKGDVCAETKGQCETLQQLIHHKYRRMKNCRWIP